MNRLHCYTAIRFLVALTVVQLLSLPVLAQTPAARPKTPSPFAPSGPGGKVTYRPVGNNVIEVAAKPGGAGSMDQAVAARKAQLQASGTVRNGSGATIRQASTARMMQEAVEEVPAPTEKSVVVPHSQSGVVMEEVAPGQQIMQGPWVDSESGQVIGDHYGQPFFSPEGGGVVNSNFAHGGVVMGDGMPAEGCADCGCYGGASATGLRVARPCADGCLIPCPRISVDNTQIFAGAQGFTGVANRGETGSFGFHEGVNLGGPFPFLHALDLSMQLGVMGTQSNHNGASFTDSSRDQLFTTVGIFHRVDWGFQGGVVFDYMHDEWYYSLDIYQLRGELSWVNPEGHEVGFWFTNSDSTQVTESVITEGTVNRTFDQSWEVTDVYAFFYRRRFCETNAILRGYGGFTENGDGIVGADATAPLSDAFALTGSFTYLIPNSDEATNLAPHQRESWNVQVGLTWFPGRGARQWTYHRPLMNVANNGNMFIQNL